jgi:hypothetical protein
MPDDFDMKPPVWRSGNAAGGDEVSARVLAAIRSRC